LFRWSLSQGEYCQWILVSFDSDQWARANHSKTHFLGTEINLQVSQWNPLRQWIPLVFNRVALHFD
jgi:hypothetical protein